MKIAKIIANVAAIVALLAFNNAMAQSHDRENHAPAPAAVAGQELALSEGEVKKVAGAGRADDGDEAVNVCKAGGLRIRFAGSCGNCGQCSGVVEAPGPPLNRKRTGLAALSLVSIRT